MFYDVLNKFNGRGLTHEEFVKADDVRDVLEAVSYTHLTLPTSDLV